MAFFFSIANNGQVKLEHTVEEIIRGKSNRKQQQDTASFGGDVGCGTFCFAFHGAGMVSIFCFLAQILLQGCVTAPSIF